MLRVYLKPLSLWYDNTHTYIHTYQIWLVSIKERRFGGRPRGRGVPVGWEAEYFFFFFGVVVLNFFEIVIYCLGFWNLFCGFCLGDRGWPAKKFFFYPYLKFFYIYNIYYLKKKKKKKSNRGNNPCPSLNRSISARECHAFLF